MLLRKIAWAIIILLFFSVPLFAHSLFNPIEFNQFAIQRLEVTHKPVSLDALEDVFQSAYSSGLNILFNEPIKTVPDFNDEKAVFRYVYSWTPSYAVVYPTEEFYYFTTTLDVGVISGSIRVADIDNGVLSMAYFTVPEKEVKRYTITTDDELVVGKKTDYVYDVTYDNKRVRFILPTTGTKEPTQLELLPEEQFIGQIHDESGIKFFLLYNHHTKSFYDVLNEEDGVTETLEELDENHLLGERTGFVYYTDEEYERTLLVGVMKEHVDANSFFDGPADQVPISINIQDALYDSYRHLNRGDIDEYGVYTNTKQWERVAIAPFNLYTNTNEILKQPISAYWTCLTTMQSR
jgi:hypothetical protein